MIEILPIKQDDLLNMLNKRYNCDATKGFICVEKKQIISSCLYKVQGDTAYFLNVSTVMEDIFDGLVRASFASLIDEKIDKAYFDKSFDFELLNRLNFVKDNSFFVKSLSDIIDNLKKCKKT